MVGRRARNIVAGVVTTVWVVNFTANLLVASFTPDPSVNAAFMVVLGAIFGVEAIRGARRKGGDDE